MPNDSTANVFWKNVSKQLINQRMNLLELAEEAGVSNRSLIVARYHDSALRVGTVIRISDVLGVSPSSLLGESFGNTNETAPDYESLTNGVLESAINSTHEEALRQIIPCLSTVDKNAIIKIANSLKENK